MERRLVCMLMVLLGACHPQRPTESVAEVTIPGPEAPVLALDEAAPAAAPTGPNFANISLEPGFVPDPYVFEGVTGGDVNAATLDPQCLGSIAQVPDFVFEARQTFATLAIMAASDGDMTLVVQRPDGTYVCNDDFEGLNPMVRGNFPAGTYNIWVGDYDPNGTTRFRFGISELTGSMPSSL